MRMFGLWKEEQEPVDADLPEDLVPVQLADWLALIARMRIPKTRKLVAVMASAWGSHDGSEIRPAMKTVADMSGEHVTSARKHVQALVDMRMLVVKRAGGGRGNPTVYRLTRPADITVLPLWLDPEMKRVPDGAQFVPVETLAPALENEVSSNTHSLAPALGNEETPDLSNAYSLAFTKGVSGSSEAETLVPALGYGPVDNSAEAEKGSDSAPKHSRFDPPFAETLAPALADLLQADLQPDQTQWLPQAGNSLGWRERAVEPGTFAGLVGPPKSAPWIPPGTPAAAALAADHAGPPPGPRTYAPDPPPAPRIVHGAAVAAPTAEAAAALAVLAVLPGEGEWWRHAAARELRRDGNPDPSAQDLAIRAAAILRRTDLERSA